MEKITKILLIACVILIAALSLTIGLFLGNQSNTPSVLNATNNTTPIDNTSVTRNQSIQTKNASKTNSDILSKSDIINIVNSETASNNIETISNIVLKNANSEAPFYRVYWNRNPNKKDQPHYWDIDAHTGQTINVVAPQD